MQNSPQLIARVAIDSPLPQLDRVFDYFVPEEFHSLVAKGIRVRVPFGRGGSLHDGFIVEVSDKSDFDGKLSCIADIVSTAQVLAPQIYKVARAVADRQAATLSDVLRLAVPDRSVAVEKKWLEGTPNNSSSSRRGTSKRETAQIRPVVTSAGPEWVRVISEQAMTALAMGESTLIIVPDFRDQEVLLSFLANTSAADSVINYSATQAKSKRYAGFLKCLSLDAAIVVGSRAAIYAPLNNLVQIILWDDGDSSHQEPSSPYSHSREIALIRQQVEQCDVFLYAHTRSTEVARLLGIGFFSDVSKNFPMPKIATSESEIRVDSMAWRAIRAGLESGPVLIQVATKGNSASLFCAECGQRASCKACHGPLWIDARNIAKCRWCNAGNLDHRCAHCGSQKLKQGSPGSNRTVAEFGKAFPGIRVIESTGDSPIVSVAGEPTLVIATPGAEPYAPGGYASVVILDANRSLGKDSLRATEDAVRVWANAIALMSAAGQAVLVGVSGMLATKFSLWAIDEIAQHELKSRIELRYPPAVRMASVGAERKLLESISAEIAKINGVEVLGPVSFTDKGVETEARILLKYEYSLGAKLAAELKAQSLKFSSGQQRYSAKSGRAMRPIRVKMDDVEVI